MTKLSDTQTILLSSASRRESGSLYPLPDILSTPKPAITKALSALMALGLAEERETGDQASIHRVDGNLRYGMFITTAGLSAIGASEARDSTGHEQSGPAPASTARVSKSATVIALLQRDTGATLPELIAATGWLPHTTRAALTGLRKKGICSTGPSVTARPATASWRRRDGDAR